jgi:hypothetical protein
LKDGRKTATITTATTNSPKTTEKTATLCFMKVCTIPFPSTKLLAEYIKALDVSTFLDMTKEDFVPVVVVPVEK